MSFAESSRKRVAEYKVEDAKKRKKLEDVKQEIYIKMVEILKISYIGVIEREITYLSKKGKTAFEFPIKPFAYTNCSEMKFILEKFVVDIRDNMELFSGFTISAIKLNKPEKQPSDLYCDDCGIIHDRYLPLYIIKFEWGLVKTSKKVLAKENTSKKVAGAVGESEKKIIGRAVSSTT